MDLTSIKGAYEIVAALGFPFVLFLLLFGSYAGIYYWGPAIRAERTECKAREAKLEEQIAKALAAAAEREAHQQSIIEKMMNQMLEAAGLLKESARRVSR